MKTITVTCVNTNKSYKIPLGTTLQELKGIVYPRGTEKILGALVNNQLQDLQYVVITPVQVKFIDYTTTEGYQIYCRSLIFVLYHAISELYPNYKLRVEYPIANGLYCSIINGGKSVDEETILRLKMKMREIVDENLPIKREEVETSKVCRFFRKQGLKDKAELLENRGKFNTSLYYLNRTFDYFYGALAPSTGFLSNFDLIHYKTGMLLILPDRRNIDQLLPYLPQEKLFQTFNEHRQWGKVISVTDIHHLNHIVKNNFSAPMIQISEALHEKKIAEIADEIKKRKKRVKIVLIAGPSSSGKTTFGKRLAVQLMVNCIKPINLSLDNYFVNRELTPKDDRGEYDYETIDALDINTFHDNMQRILRGEEVELPKFSFETGKRYYDGEKIRMQKNNIIIIEGIHGLNPKLTNLLPPESYYKIFISALTAISIDSHNIIMPSDNRLIRRMVRDYKYRNNSALDTLKRWDSVLAGEQKHIIPYQEEADIMFNSALIYELGVLKSHAEPLLREITQQNVEHAKAAELLKFFSYLQTVPTKGIPPTSILREFLGESSFIY